LAGREPADPLADRRPCFLRRLEVCAMAVPAARGRPITLRRIRPRPCRWSS